MDGLKNDAQVNLAIIGGGRTCEFFLDFLQGDSMSFFSPRIVCVCDVNLDAPGIRRARQMGIPTTSDYHDIFKISGLAGIIETTKSREVVLELHRVRPRGMWVLEHNISRLLHSLFSATKNLRSTQEQAELDRAVSDIILHQTRDPILLLDPDFTVVDGNEGYLDAVGKTRGEAIGKKCYEVIYGFSSPCAQWAPEMPCPMLETLKSGQKAQCIHERETGDGRVVFCHLETYPIKNEEKEVVRVLEIQREITEELPHRWEKRVQDLKTDLGKAVNEDRMLSLGKLAASCAHEINNPIQGLLTFGSLMKGIVDKAEPSPEEQDEFKHYLALMCSELERCGKIVTGLLSFARESSPSTRELDVNEVIQSVITLTRHHMQLNDIDLKLELASLPLIMSGDLNQLQQCFLNLVFNAIEATSRGGTITIRTDMDRDNGRINVVVRDTGCGIHPDNLNSIFDPFFTTKGSGQGTGLGLSIAYGIVRGHSGGIRVESELNKGAAFHLWFPPPALSGPGPRAGEEPGNLKSEGVP